MDRRSIDPVRSGSAIGDGDIEQASGWRTLGVAGADLAPHRRPRARRPQPSARRVGPAAPAARWRCRSTPTTRPSRCATGDESPMRISQGQYGHRPGHAPDPRAAGPARGPFRLLLLPGGVRACCHPDEVRAVVRAAGHEIGIHSWIHEANTTLPPGAERDLTFRAADALEQPGRHAGPSGCGPRQLGLLSVDTLEHHPRAGPAVRQLA